MGDAFEDFNNWWISEGKQIVLERWNDCLTEIVVRTFKEYIQGVYQSDEEILNRIKDINDKYDFVVVPDSKLNITVDLPIDLPNDFEYLNE